jgi:HSP20 family protein
MAYRLSCSTASPLLDALVGFNSPWETAPQAWSPRVDLVESDAAYLVRVELPGVSPDDVTLTLENRVLTLKGAKHLAKLDEGVTRHVHERLAGEFERRFRFPVPVEASAVEATFAHGLLTVSVAKTAAAQPRTIPIKTAE